VETATPAIVYKITGSGTEFTATKSGATVGTAGQPIQTVINAIRTDADVADCVIHFGDGTDTLNIGTTSAIFNNTGGTWGLVELRGKITSVVPYSSNPPAGTIVIAGNISVTSTADIANTVNNGYAICPNSTGTLTISGGTVSAPLGYAVRSDFTSGSGIGRITVSGTAKVTTVDGKLAIYIQKGSLVIEGGTISTSSEKTDASAVNTIRIDAGPVMISGGTILVSAEKGMGDIYAVCNNSTDAVTISGGTISAIGKGIAVANSNTGTVTISGGTVQATGTYGLAVRNNSTGKITVSGTAHITSANTDSTQGTIYIASDGTATAERLVITGGRVENTSTTTGNAVYNLSSTGGVTISGGTISAAAGVAVYNANTGKITVSGTAHITSANTISTQGTILIANNLTATAERLVITGGRVENTSTTTGNAVYNNSTGAVTISGGTVSKAGAGNYAVYINSTGEVNITSGTIVGNNYRVP